MIHKRLSEIQRTLIAPKNQRNKFGNYNYRSCEDILNAVKLILQSDESVIITDEIILIGDRYYIKAIVTFKKGTEEVKTVAFARESENKKGMDDAQVTGATSSYARKYALNGLFAIDDNKDPDATNKHGKEEKSTQLEPEEQQQDIPDYVIAEIENKQIEECKNHNSKAIKESEEALALFNKKEDTPLFKEKVAIITDVSQIPDYIIKEYPNMSKNSIMLQINRGIIKIKGDKNV